MKKRINIPALICAILAAVSLVAICCGAKQHFFGLLVFGGLAYALFIEDIDEKPINK